MIMFFHLYIFGDSGIVNGTDNKINIDWRISFIQNMSLSFDSFGILIILFNFGNLALGMDQNIIKIYQDYQIKKEKEEI